MNYFRKHKRGITGTIIFHAIVLVLLLLFGFIAVFPPPSDEGILVNFGDSDQGLGLIEPAPAPNNNPEPPEKEEKKEEPKVIPPPPSVPKTKPEPVKEEAMTQDYEETAAMKAAEKKRQDQLKEEKRIRDELERQKQAELERQRRQEQERIAREEAERKRQEDEQRKIAEIDARTKGAFGKSGTGPGGEGTGKDPNQGVTFPGGNQGVPTGDPNSENYGPGGKGSGTQGSGVSYSLAGRSALSLPKPEYPGNEGGLVVVQVTVDKSGNVTKAVAGARGTTLADQRFWNAAQQAAIKAKFNVSSDAPALQQGTITYKFTLQ